MLCQMFTSEMMDMPRANFQDFHYFCLEFKKKGVEDFLKVSTEDMVRLLNITMCPPDEAKVASLNQILANSKLSLDEQQSSSAPVAPASTPPVVADHTQSAAIPALGVDLQPKIQLFLKKNCACG